MVAVCVSVFCVSEVLLYNEGLYPRSFLVITAIAVLYTLYR